MCDDAGVIAPVDARWCVYLLRCADGSLYTGITRDLPRRLRQHNGELVGGSRYTRSRRPVALAWSTQAECRAEAQRLEASIKALSRAAKWALVRG
ncbi:GIY-YIG nuclease family protein [Chromatocurvus halotolerans]|uniref:GIY-YIG nuclease family protein n=1 Tax=Chromatocurvus halotolerans TaxID=1132028 RepID=UPI000E3E3123|nr:GIY-YIG nuclease family protein [Chromatocurvus halotolerans]